MNKNFVGGFECPVCPHAGCGPNSMYTRIKLCDRSQLIGSRFFCYNSPAAAAREVFKPSTDAESLLGSI